MQWKLKKSSLQLFCKMIELWLDPYYKAKTSEKTNSYYDYTTKLTFDLRTFSTYLCFSESWKYMPKAAKRHQYFEWGPVLQNREFYFWDIMCQSIQKFNIPPWATPRAFELLKIGLFKFSPLGAKKPFKCPTN